MKTLNSIIRVPRICYKFQKVLRKKYKANESQKKDQKEAYDNLKDQIEEHDKDETKFVESFLTYVDDNFPLDKSTIFEQPIVTDMEMLSEQEKET